MGAEAKSKGRVLLVDDSDDLREAMSSLLGDRFEVFEACNGQEALTFLDQNQVDVIVLDENMPKMGGHECFVVLRQRSVYVPVIFCTGKPVEDYKKRELQLGAFDYITKPLNAEAFVLLVAEAHEAMLRIRQILERKPEAS